MTQPPRTRFHSLSGPSEKQERRLLGVALPLIGVLTAATAISVFWSASPSARPLMAVFFVGALVVPWAVVMVLQGWLGRRGKRGYYITEAAIVMRDHAGVESVLPLKEIQAVEVERGHDPVIRVRDNTGSAPLGLALGLRSDQEYEGILRLLEDLAKTEARATFDRTVFEMLALHADAVAHRATDRPGESRLLAKAWRDLSEGRFWMAEYKFARAARRGQTVDGMDTRLSDLLDRFTGT